MKVFKNINILILTLVVFLSTNGFFVEKYLCSSCQHLHNQVAFFEFGEYSHDHPSCNNCKESNKTCSCSDCKNDHEKNSIVSFYSLDQIFFESGIYFIPKISFKELFSSPFFNSWDISGFINFNNTFHGFLKYLSFLTYNQSEINSQALLSVFRL